MTERKQRANGIASRAAILDAAAQIAGERGYEGTGIKAVSERSGLPASSIYWHFKNKDELIAAVIERSFAAWVESLDQIRDIATSSDPLEAFVETFRASARQLARFPDFLRLGLMLMLEQRPNEPTARRRFQSVRAETLQRLDEAYRLAFPAASAAEAKGLAALTLAASDGLFVAAGAEEIDLVEGFEGLARAVYGAALVNGWATQPTPRSAAARS